MSRDREGGQMGGGWELKYNHCLPIPEAGVCVLQSLKKKKKKKVMKKCSL